MATHDYVISNASGASVRADLNNALAAIVSNNSNATSPATTYAYQWWADTTTGQLKLRNSANSAWITIFELDGTMLMEDGTLAAPGLAFASDLDTGFSRSASNKINFSTGGAERLEIGDSEVVFNDPSNDVDFRVESNGQSHMLFVDAGNDRVGIGTSSPTHKLTVFDSTADVIANLESGDSIARIQLKDSAGTNYISSVGTNLDFATNGVTAKMRIDSSGRLLVATTSSTANSNADDLQIGARTDSGERGITVASSAAGSIRFADDGNDTAGYLFYSHSDNSLRFGSDGTERMRIDSSGNVGIGTSSPSTSLEVVGNTTPQLKVGMANDADRASLMHNGSNLYLDTTAGALIFRGASNAERMRIDSSGRLLVGTTTAVGTSNAVIIKGTSGVSNASIYLGNTANASTLVAGNTLGFIEYGAADGGTGAQVLAAADGTWSSTSDCPTRLVFSTCADSASSPTERMRIDSSGNLIQYSTGTLNRQHRQQSSSVYTATNIRSVIDGAAGYLAFDTNQNWTNGNAVERMRILAAGGLTFNGDTAAANALDDYEEGSWTPEFAGETTAGTYTYGSRSGTYTKIGNFVMATFNLVNINTSSVGVGTAMITGLPFTSSSSFSFNPTVPRFDNFNLGSATYVTCLVDNASTRIKFFTITTNASDNVLSVTAKNADTSDVFGTVIYHT